MANPLQPLLKSLDEKIYQPLCQTIHKSLTGNQAFSNAFKSDFVKSFSFPQVTTNSVLGLIGLNFFIRPAFMITDKSEKDLDQKKNGMFREAVHELYCAVKEVVFGGLVFPFLGFMLGKKFLANSQKVPYEEFKALQPVTFSQFRKLEQVWTRAKLAYKPEDFNHLSYEDFFSHKNLAENAQSHEVIDKLLGKLSLSNAEKDLLGPSGKNLQPVLKYFESEGAKVLEGAGVASEILGSVFAIMVLSPVSGNEVVDLAQRKGWFGLKPPVAKSHAKPSALDHPQPEGKSVGFVPANQIVPAQLGWRTFPQQVFTPIQQFPQNYAHIYAHEYRKYGAPLGY